MPNVAMQSLAPGLLVVFMVHVLSQQDTLCTSCFVVIMPKPRARG